MQPCLVYRLKSLVFGPAQRHRRIAILPLMAQEGGLVYKTLSEALAKGEISISEISASGSVPELLVINRSPSPVLLLDGEELAGAKQNRVLNTSILLKPCSETRIPVSCTERGRWSYASPVFDESGNVLAHKIRALKSKAVSSSLELKRAYCSDQGQVWAEIDALHAKAASSSPTSAMSDAFAQREKDLGEAAEVFTCLPGQAGILVFIDGRPVGLDLLSRHSAYAALHGKLVRSYALETLLEPGNGTAAAMDLAPAGLAFVDRVMAAQERSFPSAGLGCDFRYHSEGHCGAALIHENEAVHAGFFQLELTQRSAAAASDIAWPCQRRRARA